MVRIRHMWVCMHHRLMYVGVAVRADRHWIVRVVMVTVVVPMGMLMFKSLVRMLVSVGLRQVQHHPQHHQQATHGHDPGAATVPQSNGNCGADKGGEGEHRTRARRAEGTLGQQVKAQAQAVARGFNSEKSKCCG